MAKQPPPHQTGKPLMSATETTPEAPVYTPEARHEEVPPVATEVVESQVPAEDRYKPGDSCKLTPNCLGVYRVHSEVIKFPWVEQYMICTSCKKNPPTPYKVRY